MQRRPSVIYIRRRCIRRRAIRCWLVFLCSLAFLLLCGASFIFSLILAALCTLVFRIWIVIVI
jgi:fatty acid desaturase